MVRSYNRKTAPKVVNGTVKKKNNHTKTATLGYVVDRERPGKGYTHVLKKKDIHDFIDIIPEWHKYSEGIESIVIARGEECLYGVYRHYSYEDTGIIYLCAWEEDMWVDISEDFFHKHTWIFDNFGLTYEKKQKKDPSGRGKYTEWGCYFTESQAKAFMLLNTFLHELGHHIQQFNHQNDELMKLNQESEPFAEDFAKKMFQQIWPAYVKRFGLPERQ